MPDTMPADAVLGLVAYHTTPNPVACAGAMPKRRETPLMALTYTLKRHPVPAYFVLVYALSWACWIPLAIARTWLSFPYIVFAVAGNGMPSLLGIVLTALVGGKAGLAELFGRLGRVRAPLIWYAVVLLLIPALRLAAAGIPALLGLATITVAFSGFTVLGGLGAALLEELGWRGFALPRMQARRPAFTASLLLGALWGAWHLPVQIAQGLPLTAAGLIPFLFSLLMLTALAVLFTWVYNNASGSLFLMVLLHAVAYTTGSAIQPGNWIGSALLLILTWATVTLIVATAGSARLSRGSVVLDRTVRVA